MIYIFFYFLIFIKNYNLKKALVAKYFNEATESFYSE